MCNFYSFKLVNLEWLMKDTPKVRQKIYIFTLLFVDHVILYILSLIKSNFTVEQNKIAFALDLR